MVNEKKRFIMRKVNTARDLVGLFVVLIETSEAGFL